MNHLLWDESSASAISKQLGEPAALHDRRLDAVKRLKTTPWPNAFQENWRRTDPHQIGIRHFGLAAAETVEPDQIPDFGDRFQDAHVLNFHNLSPVKLIPAYPLSKGKSGSVQIEAGVHFAPLSELFNNGDASELAGIILDATVDTDSPAVGLAQTAWWGGGAGLIVKKSANPARPFVIRHHANTPGSALFPLNIVNLAAQSRATLIIENTALGDEKSWFAGLTRVRVGDGASLEMLVMNHSSSAASFYDHLQVSLGRDAKFNLTWADLTDGWSVIRREIVLAEKGGEARMSGVHVGSGQSHADMRTLQDHPAPSTVSDLLYKVALFGHSKSVYQGLIKVGKEAVGANAYQLNRNLLMSQDSRADSIPKLEIDVDEVRCTHGASSGKVDREALFYLMSRGLSRAAATRLMVESFLGEAGSKLDGEQRAFWREAVIEYLDRSIIGELMERPPRE